MNRFAILSLSLLLASCGEAVDDNHFADDLREERPVAGPVMSEAVPVRVGELGPSFPACNASGTTRNLGATEALPVRSAPFDTAPQTGQVPGGTGFAVCARSHDQKWFGIVFADQGSAIDCAVSAPATERRPYQGPCKSGWVSSAFVKLVAGTRGQTADSTVQNSL